MTNAIIQTTIPQTLYQQPPSILDAAIDERYLAREWDRAREKFLFHVMTRSGMEPEQLRTNTEKVYRIALQQFFDGMYTQSNACLWPVIDPWRVSPGLILEWKQLLGLAGKPVTRNGAEVSRAGLSASSINLKLAALKAFYDFVQHTYEIPYIIQHAPFIEAELMFLSENKHGILLWSPQWRNPADSRSIDRFSVDPYGKAVYPTTGEIKSILACIKRSQPKGKRDYALLVALFSTGCRATEILNLRWGDLVQAKNGNYTFSFRGKNGKENTVEMNARTRDLICQYLDAYNRLETIHPDDYIFSLTHPERSNKAASDPYHTDPELMATNHPLSTSVANRILKKYGKLAGVDKRKCHLHGLRHARANQTATDMEEAKGAVDLISISKMLRHSSLAVTQTYLDGIMSNVEDPWSDAALDAITGEEI